MIRQPLVPAEQVHLPLLVRKLVNRLVDQCVAVVVRLLGLSFRSVVEAGKFHPLDCDLSQGIQCRVFGYHKKVNREVFDFHKQLAVSPDFQKNVMDELFSDCLGAGNAVDMRPQPLVVMIENPCKSPLAPRGHLSQELFFIVQYGPVRAKIRQNGLGYNWCTTQSGATLKSNYFARLSPSRGEPYLVISNIQVDISSRAFGENVCFSFAYSFGLHSLHSWKK